jgi:hypothetical protein
MSSAGEKTAIIGLLAGIYAIIIAIGSVSIVYGKKYESTHCTSTATDAFTSISLQTWLLVNGIVPIITNTLEMIIALFVVGAAFSGIESLTDTTKATGVAIVVITTLGKLFSFAWLITGGFVLFGDSMSCRSEAKPLWDCGLAMFIINCIALLVVVMKKCCGESKSGRNSY